MRIYEEVAETGEYIRRWAELEPVESDGTNWRTLAELIVDSGIIPDVLVKDSCIIFAPKALLALDDFLSNAKEAQFILTSTMDEARKIHRLMALWDRAVKASKAE